MVTYFLKSLSILEDWKGYTCEFSKNDGGRKEKKKQISKNNRDLSVSIFNYRAGKHKHDQILYIISSNIITCNTFEKVF